jgi:hypothetical protein
MKNHNAVNVTKTSGEKLTKSINIPPQSTVPKMPPVQPPKKSKDMDT